MDNLIRRQDAIDSIMEEPSEARYPVFYAEKIRQLPPAQQEHSICYLDGPCEYQTKDITLWNIYVEVARYEAAKMDERVVNAMVNGVARDCGIELDKDKLNAMAEFYKRLCMCKDCVHCQQTAVTWCMYHDTSVTNKGFCSWGRRKENG